MTQYIDKSALVAEIEKIYDEDYKFLPSDIVENVQNFRDEILRNINTLEVKEIDLEKESELIANGIMISVQSNKYDTNIYNTERNDFNHYHLQMAARKGIELALKVQKGE